MRWDIITGEYPPQPGGVSDYTRQIAQGLAAAGDEVHVWAPACLGSSEFHPRVTVHRLPGCFGVKALRALGKALTESVPRQILVQYVAQAFGWRGANVAFCLWLWTYRHETISALFHEVSVPFERARGLRWNSRAVITLAMAALVAHA